MSPDDTNLNPGASSTAPGNSAAAAAAQPTAPQTHPSSPETAPQSSGSPAAAASSPERPAAYEGSEPSLLQKTTATEPPKADVQPAEAGTADSPKPAERPAEAPPAEGAKVEDKPAKPGEAAKPEGDAAKPAEAAAAPAPVEYKYALPETVKLADPQKAELHGILDKFRADPGNVQPLVDFYTGQMADYAKSVDAHNRTVFNEMRAENRKAIMADPILGGSGHQTISQAVARMRDMLIPPDMLQPRKFDDGKPRLSIADEFLESTGAGDHPVLWHMLHNAARYLDEPQAHELPANPRPPKDIGKPPKGRFRELYNHPTSNK